MNKCALSLASLCLPALFLFPACSSPAVHADAGASPPAPSEAGSVTIPVTSPMLRQITRQPVATADLPTDEVIAPGKIDANPNRVSKVVLPVAGRIGRVLVKVGDAVQTGQPLLTLASPDADAAMSACLAADAAVMQAKAANNKARADLDRASDLFEHDAVAKKDVQAAESALAQAAGTLQQTLAAREQALRRAAVLGLKPGDFAQDVVVRAPLAGKVLELSVVPGEFRNDTSASLMTIADLSTVWVTSQVPESSIRFVKVGERVEINLAAYPSETFAGRVTRLADIVDPQTRTIKVHAELPNPNGRFRPDMYGSIRIVESTARIAVVPATAIVHSGNRTVVFLERTPGHFVERVVTLGKPVGNVIRVLSGLTPGDAIVVDGVMLLEGLVKAS